jgi:FKBP-type peptidyl-prolyl cis-trans isomerase FklB
MKTGEEFLAENAKKEGVVSLPSGLQYEVMTMGTGEKPLAHNTVTCHYHGTVISGEVFDSSVQRGQPASFPLNAVISGWTEALQLMPTGSKWRLFLPPHLAYGNRQVSRVIGSNSTLIFEVELISFR